MILLGLYGSSCSKVLLFILSKGEIGVVYLALMFRSLLIFASWRQHGTALPKPDQLSLIAYAYVGDVTYLGETFACHTRGSPLLCPLIQYHGQHCNFWQIIILTIDFEPFGHLFGHSGHCTPILNITIIVH